MLWCKATFQREFSDDQCRLFPTQQQLFDFLDHANTAASPAWGAFSIEFPSEQEVVRQLSRHGQAASRLFRRIDTTSNATTAQNLSHCTARPVREDYAVLYGPASLSTQSRMFLAATDDGVGALLARIEPAQRHVYEIIRDGVPCHLYFDVECSTDYVALRAEHGVDDDDTMVVAATAHTNHGDRVYRADVAEYERTLACVAAAAWQPHTCALTCRVRPDHTATTRLLLCELAAFLADSFPALLAPNLKQCAGPDWLHAVRALGEVVVLRSEPADAGKFSQHYTIKLPHHRLANAHPTARELVRRFVAHLQHRASEDAAVHAGLFYHGEPRLEHTASRTDAVAALPFLPRRCVIDTAVYSRNRAMRCAGSTKLHKTSVLQLEHHLCGGVDVTAQTRARGVAGVFFASLITRTAPQDAVFALDADARATSPSPERGLVASRVQCAPVEPCGGDDVARAVVAELQQAYGIVCGVACEVAAAARVVTHDGAAPRFALYHVTGTRYCQNVGREHKSNRVYLVVDWQKGTWVQKCFDPDCAHFRSPPHPLRCLSAPSTSPAAADTL